MTATFLRHCRDALLRVLFGGFLLAQAQGALGQAKVRTEPLELHYDERTQAFSLTRRNSGETLLEGTHGVSIAGTSTPLTGSLVQPVEIVTSSGLLAGPSLKIQRRSEGPAALLSVVQATLLADRPGLVMEVTIRNTGSEKVELNSIQPLRALTTEARGCRFSCSTLLTNGRIYYDPGKVLPFGSISSETIDSFWNAAFHSGNTGETLVAGFLDNIEGEGHIVARRAAPERFDLCGESRSNSRSLLAPGEQRSSGRLLLLFSDDGFTGLETYAELLGQLHGARLNPIINGWCTWSGYYSDITEAEVLKNAEFIARELKPYGMEWVQIDDGFQRGFGDWEGQPAKFPHGMKATAQAIRAAGLKPGLWIAPFAVSASSALAKEHPEWLAHRPDGSLQPIVPAHQAQAQYILDATHPGARRWLRDLLRTLTEDWGYDFIKTDFSEWTLLSVERYFDPSATTARAYRLGVEAIREGMGPERHMLDCATGPTVVGLLDSMRIELDRPIPENPLWHQYAGFYNSTGPAVAKRYYFHDRAWINDADHIRMVGLTLPQSRAAATITALAGGNLIAGDRLYDLDGERLNILKKVFPAWGHAARPLDLFTTDSAELFHLPIRNAPAGSWDVLGCFNWSETTRTRVLDLPSLGLKAPEGYLVYDFWGERLLDGSPSLSLAQEPTSVHLLAIRERKDVPQVIGTTRHFTQGAIELKKVEWAPEKRILSGIAVGTPEMRYRVTVHVPEGYTFQKETEGGAEVSTDAQSPGILHVSPKFTESGECPWSLQFAGSNPSF